MLDDYSLERVRHVLAEVGGRFEKIVNLFELDNRDRIFLVREQVRHRAAHQLIGLVLQTGDFAQVIVYRVGVLDVAAMADGVLDVEAALLDDPRQVVPRACLVPEPCAVCPRIFVGAGRGRRIGI